MKRIALVVSREYKSWAEEVFSRHKGSGLRIAFPVCWSEQLQALSNNISRAYRAVKINLYSLAKLLRLRMTKVDAVLLVGEDSKTVMNMLYRIVSSCRKERSGNDIFFVKPFYVRSHKEFISAEGFDPEIVKHVPFSEKAFPAAEEILKQVVPCDPDAAKAFETPAGIKAYETENILVKVCSEGLLGCTYKPDGTILSGCLNGDKPYLYSMCSHEISGSRKPDIVLDECVCPLARLYSLESSYHFMYEVLDKIIIAEELGFQGKYMLFRNDYADCLLEQLRVSRDRVIWLDKRDSGKIFALKKAFDAEGFGLDSHKGLAVLNKFADDMLHRAGRKADYPGKIFIASGRKNKAPEGFAEIYHAEHSPEEMINFFMNADVVMSADCIAMACVLFMRRGAELISMFPNNWSSLLAGVIASRGLKYRPE